MKTQVDDVLVRAVQAENIRLRAELAAAVAYSTQLHQVCEASANDIEALMFNPDGRVCVRDIEFWSEGDKRVLERTLFSLREAAKE